MKKGDVTCSECGAGFRRLELFSMRGVKSEYCCPVCNQTLEVFDGSTEVAYRLTVASCRYLDRSGELQTDAGTS